MTSYKPIRLQLQFDHFASLPSGIGKFTSSEKQTDANGNKWKVDLYPGGRYRESKGFVALMFSRIGGAEDEEQKGADASIHVSIRDKFGEEVHEGSCWVCQEQNKKESLSGKMGHLADMKLIRYSKIIENKEKYLADDSLRLDLCIQVAVPDDKFHKPHNPVLGNLIALYESNEGADVMFEIDGERFEAHSQILLANAPIFSDMCRESTCVTLNGVCPVVFDILMHYIYAGELPAPNEIVQLGKELIECSNKFEVIGLKLAVETYLVQSRILNKHNVADYLVFADAKMCPLLKEYATSFFCFIPKMYLIWIAPRS